ncbi:hypothetical protein RN001_011785 [Aquatica leii]|uniref:Uncharacterized protein n=1 Tax=Aquatica leii TaxID=1421715 RepID=A0AAN7P4M4_9COLE|nr:hypothetical protein RN001_011785 [Aquatica leii]
MEENSRSLKEEIRASMENQIKTIEEQIQVSVGNQIKIAQEETQADMLSTSLIVSLRGEALGILQTVPDHLQENYELLISRLEMRYEDAHLQQVYQAQIKSRVQKAAESLQEFEADIARLTRLAYPTAPDTFLEQLAI